MSLAGLCCFVRMPHVAYGLEGGGVGVRWLNRGVVSGEAAAVLPFFCSGLQPYVFAEPPAPTVLAVSDAAARLLMVYGA